MSFRFFLLTIAPPLLGVGLGYLLGGRLAGLRSLRIRALWLVWVAAAVQFAQYSLGGVRHFVENVVGVPMLAVVFATVLGWLAVNLPRWPAAIRLTGLAIVLGAVLNGVVIAANGRMPYDPAAVAKAGGQPGSQTAKNEPAGAGTRLAWLGDTIPIPGLRKVASPGDVLISAGACAFVVLAMRRRLEPKGVNH
ncbi:DUF5317 family protein [Asanoa iriomotensis]|uniref:DUF5317 domain-containing protein n=1 Tax=Asanoa iriomotensis TaxID=234613 RepID=A0ABQ4C5C1_9ACTN|nr:DUF5317 family protein [Asanoa iriomotensis]GIF57975.1 hypothetical protein Air01nite_40700 [Asanoa iriomotensis]